MGPHRLGLAVPGVPHSLWYPAPGTPLLPHCSRHEVTRAVGEQRGIFFGGVLARICDALPAGSEPAARGRNGTGMRIPPTPYARATGSNPVGSASQTRASGGPGQHEEITTMVSALVFALRCHHKSKLGRNVATLYQRVGKQG